MREDLATALALAFLDGDWRRPALVDRGRVVLGRRPRWLSQLAGQLLEQYPRPPRDRPRELATVLRTLPAADRATGARPLRVVPAGTRMVVNPWRLPELHDLADLAAAVRLSEGDLAWFADVRRMARHTAVEPLRHYRVTTRASSSGAVRVLEAPKVRLKTLQRRLLSQIVGRIPPHDACHGFRPGRSVASFATPHVGQAVVVRLDLESFFAAVDVGRVYGTFRTAGYPEAVAHALAGLTTTVLPQPVWRSVPHPSDPTLLEAHWRLGRRLASPHLPQGAPTSPALANLVARRLDVRLSALAQSWDGVYTRYADDLAFSAGRSWSSSGTSRLLDLVGEVVRDEGFRLNDRKTAVLPRTGRQVVGGLVVNEMPKVARREVDALRALLHNCAVRGAAGQNRDAHPDFERHLRGRVAWVGQHDPARGARLLAQLEAVDWSAG